MPIPDFQTAMLPLLRFAADRKEHAFREAVEALADEFSLTDAERAELLPSGRALLFTNRIGWARMHLKGAGLIEPTKRGYFRITEAGIGLLAESPQKIDMRVLSRYELYRDWRAVEKSTETSGTPQVAIQANEQTPEDAMAAAYGVMRKALEAEVLEQIKASSPAFFEQLVVDLVVAMGYGGSHQDAGRAIGRSGDGGIDGIINEDKLGLDVIYLQAKRWDNTVGRPEIQKFAGALQGEGASKGIFITTSTFTKEAIDFSKRNIAAKIILIDGEKLTALMFDHNVAVTRTGFYEIKKIDSDYFEGE